MSEAKATLSRLVQRAIAGESIAIGRRGRPEVVLRAYSPDDTPRVLGFLDGADYWMADNFDDPMAEVESLFGEGQPW